MNGASTDKPARILLLGATGQLGRELRIALAPLGELVVARRRPTNGPLTSDLAIDLASPSELRAAVRDVSPHWIVNAAAYTFVDRAEADVEAARAVNEIAPAILAEEARRLGSGLIHYSTEYVFDGSGERPWREDDPVAPLNVYGRTKAAGEAAIRQAGCPHLILRTSWLYGIGQNFVTKMFELADRQTEIAVVGDQVGAPTSARFVAEVTASLLRRMLDDPKALAAMPSTLHVACSGATSWHGFAEEIFRVASGRDAKWRQSRLRAVTSAEFAAAARRPLNSRLDTGRLSGRLGQQPPAWQEEFARLFPAIYGYYVQTKNACHSAH